MKNSCRISKANKTGNARCGQRKYDLNRTYLSGVGNERVWAHPWVQISRIERDDRAKRRASRRRTLEAAREADLEAERLDSSMVEAEVRDVEMEDVGGEVDVNMVDVEEANGEVEDGADGEVLNGDDLEEVAARALEEANAEKVDRALEEANDGEVTEEDCAFLADENEAAEPGIEIPVDPRIGSVVVVEDQNVNDNDNNNNNNDEYVDNSHPEGADFGLHDHHEVEPARDEYDLKLEAQEEEEGQLPPNFEVPRQVRIEATVNGEPVGVQLLDTTKRIAKLLLRESWKSRRPPMAIDYRDRMRNVATQNNVNAIIAHVGAEAKPRGYGCQRCEDGKGPFTSCRVNASWSPNGACTSCLHGGKNGYCSFVKQARATKERREKEEIAKRSVDRRADRVRELGARFAGRTGPMMPTPGMTTEEAANVAEDAALWAEYMRLWSENIAEAQALSRPMN
ncbi:hypothetical protein AAP_02376 [Ascosphaera apis ARSEF 7405]|uniref:Uncharacterized protein n=1 Tax=Ascosphaera apis ARSEF 7405 TaxID=392613 RepID=A0A168A7X6_9EURO|nr:hypothetical protein AAP_02376 [Ascosphaera apis ARSEF 7405]